MDLFDVRGCMELWRGRLLLGIRHDFAPNSIDVPQHPSFLGASRASSCERRQRSVHTRKRPGRGASNQRTREGAMMFGLMGVIMLVLVVIPACVAYFFACTPLLGT